MRARARQGALRIFARSSPSSTPERVLFVERSELFAIHHANCASSRDSRRRSRPPRIQLFSGSERLADGRGNLAVLMPSKKRELDVAALQCGKGIHQRADFFARRDWSIAPSGSGRSTAESGRSKSAGILAAALLLPVQAQEIESPVPRHSEQTKVQRCPRAA